MAYFKRNLNPVYLNESIKTAILSQMKKIKIDRKKIMFPQKHPQRYRDYHINRDALGNIFPITGIQAFSRLAQAQTPAMSNLATSTLHSHQRCILGHIELVIFSFLGHQLIMCAFFQDRSLVHIHDAGRIFNCGKTMCDDEGGTSLQQFI